MIDKFNSDDMIEKINLDEFIYQSEDIEKKFRSTVEVKKRFLECLKKALTCAINAEIPITGYKAERPLLEMLSQENLMSLLKEFSLIVDLRADEVLIENLLDAFKKEVMFAVREMKMCRQREFDTVKELVFWDEHFKRGQSPDDLLTEAERALDAYQMRVEDEGCTHLSIASDLRINFDSHSDKDSDAAKQKVRRMLNRGEKLVHAAADGTFLKAICAPKK